MPRLFFAIWPPQAAAERLAKLAAIVAEESGGRATPPGNVHLTLEFLGEVADERIGLLESVAAKLAAPRFTFTLDRLGAFRRARIAWVGSAEPSPGLIELQRTLNGGLRQAGFALEERPYSPHVTLARHARKTIAKRPIEPIAWTVSEFALVRSEPGRARYATLARFRLD